MRLTYLQEAELELTEAVTYYSRHQDSLGRVFFGRVKEAEDEILQYPEAWYRLSDRYRRKLLAQFPYGLIYHQPAPDWIEVVAVMHLHRQPNYWQKRIQS